MPPLPRKPGWEKAAPSAKAVRNAYVDVRHRELERVADHADRVAIEALRDHLNEERKQRGKWFDISDAKLLEVFRTFTRNLQGADLTINFRAQSWFDGRPTYDSYTQMYERAIKDGVMVLFNQPQNPVETRVKADDAVSFPKSWAHAQEADYRGLRPHASTGPRVYDRMHTGGVTGDRNVGFQAVNPRFDPRSKQLFAALNYGRRPHGSNIGYGSSHFVLKDQMKARALYYPTDTFVVNQQKAGVTVQVPYQNLGAIYGKLVRHQDADGSRGKALKGVANLKRQLVESCVHGRRLVDTSDPFELVEAHIFGEINFREHVDHMVISRSDFTSATHNPSTSWDQIVANARAFTSKNGIKLHMTD